MKKVEELIAHSMQDNETLMRKLRIVVPRGSCGGPDVIWYEPTQEGFICCTDAHSKALEEQFQKDEGQA